MRAAEQLRRARIEDTCVGIGDEVGGGQTMSSALAGVVTRQRQVRFAGLSGSRVHLSVPIREALVQRLLAGIDLPTPLRSVSVRLLPGNQILVGGEVGVFGLTKSVEATLSVAPAVSPGPPRTLQFAFVGRSLLSTVAGLAGVLLGRLPEGTVIHDHVVTFDLDRLAERGGWGDLMTHVRSVSIAGDADVWWVDLELAVPEGPAPSPLRSASGPPPSPLRSASGPPPVRLRPQELAGLRADYRIRLSETLANAALEAALIDASVAREPTDSSSAAGDWGRFMQALDPPNVRFEPGAMIVEGTVAL